MNRNAILLATLGAAMLVGTTEAKPRWLKELVTVQTTESQGQTAKPQAQKSDNQVQISDKPTAPVVASNPEPVAPTAAPVDLPVLSESEKEDIANGEPILMSMEDLAERMKTTKGYLLIDVRRPDEFRGGHIKGAINIPVNNVSSKMGKVSASKETPIYLYCLSGVRSLAAGQKLVAQGYKRVYNCGTIDDWTGPLVKGDK